MKSYSDGRNGAFPSVGVGLHRLFYDARLCDDGRMFTPSEAPADPLIALQLQVARRADQLATSLADRSVLNLSCWLQAEEEVLRAFRAPADQAA